MNDNENINIILADIKELVKCATNYKHGRISKRKYYIHVMRYLLNEINETINRLDETNKI